MKTLKSRRYLALLFVPLVLFGLVSAPTGASASRADPNGDAQVVIDWQRIAIRTIYSATRARSRRRSARSTSGSPHLPSTTRCRLH